MTFAAFRLDFYDLSCQVTADPAWRPYFEKYFGNTPVSVADDRPGRGDCAELTIQSGQNTRKKLQFSAEFTGVGCRAHLPQEEHSLFPVVVSILERLYTRLLYRRGGFVLHGSAVMHKGRGYLFAGHSSAGKTTAARMCEERHRVPILTDNFLFIARKNGQYVIYPFPFDQFHNRSKMPEVPVAAMFFLRKSKTTGIRALSPAEKTSAFMKYCQVQISADEADSGAQREVSRNLFGYIHSATMYELSFNLKDDFWKLMV